MCKAPWSCTIVPKNVPHCPSLHCVVPPYGMQPPLPTLRVHCTRTRRFQGCAASHWHVRSTLSSQHVIKWCPNTDAMHVVVWRCAIAVAREIVAHASVELLRALQDRCHVALAPCGLWHGERVELIPSVPHRIQCDTLPIPHADAGADCCCSVLYKHTLNSLAQWLQSWEKQWPVIRQDLHSGLPAL